jgi:2-succinyl-5-enolpyruvyl-6-hydroxy-3-cyclohexene-1-carboxylate synthase
LPDQARVYLGNSSPIREWDLAATDEPKNFEIWASRGLNGIDGQTSTFIGFTQPYKENWAIIGDLTALYDLPAPWILSQMKEVPAHLVIINNGGGRIFSRIFTRQEFQNSHQISLAPWAELWGLKYEKWTDVPVCIQSLPSQSIIEIFPDEDATQRFWEAYQSFFD